MVSHRSKPLRHYYVEAVAPCGRVIRGSAPLPRTCVRGYIMPLLRNWFGGRRLVILRQRSPARSGGLPRKDLSIRLARSRPPTNPEVLRLRCRPLRGRQLRSGRQGRWSGWERTAGIVGHRGSGFAPFGRANRFCRLPRTSVRGCSMPLLRSWFGGDALCFCAMPLGRRAEPCSAGQPGRLSPRELYRGKAGPSTAP